MFSNDLTLMLKEEIEVSIIVEPLQTTQDLETHPVVTHMTPGQRYGNLDIL